MSSCGPQTANFVFGATPGKTTASINYDGTAWATAPSMGTSRGDGAPAKAGSQTAALVAGSADRIATAEEFTGETSALNVKTLTQS